MAEREMRVIRVSVPRCPANFAEADKELIESRS
jgi:hypothetical protein